MALDAIEPGTICRCEVEADVMPLRPLLDLPFEMRAVVVHNDVQLLCPGIARTDPLEESQKLRPTLALGETTVETIGFQVIKDQEVTHTAFTAVRGAYTLNPAALTHLATAMPWLQVERTELIDAQTS